MTYENRYGAFDRLLHRIAFRAGRTQRALADVEDVVFRESLKPVPLERPVFISALPRSGTTILLELLWATDRFATHTYREMPFVLCPMLWQRFARFFAVSDTRRERAHGDGLEISAESPEAFEEMIWKEFWPEHYLDDRILTWGRSDADPEFDAFLERHMRKVIVLRRENTSDERRYLSKNNLNIARFEAVPRPMRTGVFVVPFREPVQQAASMLNQHRRFTRIQRGDEFVRRYMEAIGHHEFGLALRPIDFDGWIENAGDPADLEFWLRYWIAAYRYVLKHAPRSTYLISYSALVERSKPSLKHLAAVVEIPVDDLIRQADRLQAASLHEVELSRVSDRVLEEVSEVHADLRRNSRGG